MKRLLSYFPVATAAAAIPTTVPSSITGYTLFVPVEMVIRGVFFTDLATALFVPSPPKVTMQPTPFFSMYSAAFTVSSILSVRIISITSISHFNSSQSFSLSKTLYPIL
ncbi:hypothetical protein DSECCO2_520760 [anaerobic digester metagenome]